MKRFNLKPLGQKEGIKNLGVRFEKSQISVCLYVYRFNNLVFYIHIQTVLKQYCAARKKYTVETKHIINKDCEYVIIFFE